MTKTTKPAPPPFLGFRPPAAAPASRIGLAPGLRPVFVTALELDSAKGAPAVWRTVATWLRSMRREAVDAELLVRSGSHHLASGATLDVLYTDSASPYLHALRYAHPDAEVAGRRWVTEVALRAADGAATMRVSILLATEDVAAAALPPVAPTRPALVWQFLKWNGPASSTPGLEVESLARASAGAFRARVHDPARPQPVVVVSPLPSGEYLVDTERVRRQLAGLADVVRIEPGEDLRALRDLAGEEAVPWAGGVRVLYPLPAVPYATPVPARRIGPEELDDWRIAGTPAEQEILGIVARRMVRGNLARHLTLEQVREERVKRAVARNRRDDTAQLAELRGDVIALEEMLTERDAEVSALRQELDERELELELLGEELRARGDEARKREHDVEALRVQLARATERPAARGALADPESRDSVLAVIGGAYTVSDALRAAAALFADRLVILDTAWRSAEKSSEFRHVDKALDLLTKLGGPYWEALAAGGAGDAQARAVFGSAFAATESERVANNAEGRNRRTFSYRGEWTPMLSHLKIGRKDSVAETLRIHFHWDPAEQVIVVGHCGRHLDFD